MARILIGLLITMAAVPASAADPAAGGAYFRSHCAVCHSSSPSAPQGVGPRLYGVVGRQSGSLPGYNYSQAMRQARIVWVTEVLKRYLTSPQSVVHGNKMPFPGIPKPADRENVVAFLETLR